jgi:uncharacterized damage-inducible protein DinB
MPSPDLTTSRDRALAAFALPAASLGRSYAPGKWTIRELLIHIADVESVFLERVRRVLAQDKALLLAIEPDRWHARLATPARNLDHCAQLFTACRTTLIGLAEGLSEADLARTGVHSEKGLLSLTQILGAAVWHADHHLGQIEAARDGRGWTP